MFPDRRGARTRSVSGCCDTGNATAQRPMMSNTSTRLSFLGAAFFAALFAAGLFAWMPWQTTRPAVTYDTLQESAIEVGQYHISKDSIPQGFVSIMPTPASLSVREEFSIWSRGSVGNGWVACPNGEVAFYDPNVNNCAALSIQYKCTISGSTLSGFLARAQGVTSRTLETEFKSDWPKNGRAIWNVIGFCPAIAPLVR